jgi:hypothetical protein
MKPRYVPGHEEVLDRASAIGQDVAPEAVTWLISANWQSLGDGS